MFENRLKVSAFIRNTYDILQNSLHEDVVSWAADGKGFLIKDVDRFSAEILPRYFKHKKYTSFVRQLNMYGFHKARHFNTQNYFSHQKFIKNCSNETLLLSQIKRKPQRKKKHDENDYTKNNQKKNSSELSIKLEEQENSSSLMGCQEEINQKAQLLMPTLHSQQIKKESTNYQEKCIFKNESQNNVFVYSNDQYYSQPKNQREKKNHQKLSCQYLIEREQGMKHSYCNEEELNNLIDTLIKQNQALRTNHQRFRNQVLQAQNRTIIRINLEQHQKNDRGKKHLNDEEQKKIELVSKMLTQSIITMEEIYQESMLSTVSFNVIPP